MSVFGHRIWFELDHTFDYEFYWTFVLPFRFRLEDSQEKQNDELLRTYAHPEMLQQGSIAHWILAAWCSNPRAPKAVFVRTEFVDFSQPELHFEQARLEFEPEEFIHDVYREFEPLPSFPLADEHRIRLVEAKRNLEDACQMEPAVAKSYRTMLARTLYALDDLNEAAEQYRMARSEAFGFQYASKPYIQDYFWESTYMRALCLRRSGKTADAVSALQDEPECESPRIGFSWWAAKWLSEVCSSLA